MSKHPPQLRARYLRLRGEAGLSQAQAAKECHIGRSTAHRWDMGLEGREGSLKQALAPKEVPDPIAYDDLGPDARRGLEDFSFFSEHYLARRPVPWRQVVADDLVAMLRHPDETYAAMNEPPGIGKTTLVLDVAVWSICRDRTIRVLLGAEILDRAREYLSLVARILDSARPWYDHRRKVQAAGTLTIDFGRFRPSGGPWTQDSITVEQIGGVDLSNKEPTATVASRESGFLGGRYDLELWDDLVTLRGHNDPELFDWWRREAETRLEPGGALVLLGTRVADDDLFGFVTSQTFTDDDDDQHTEYTHITFPAHRDDHCDSDHRQWDGDPDGDGCLLDPERLSARKLAARRADPNFAVTFQQDTSVTAGGGLVDPVWLDGGIDRDAYDARGCLDDREFGQWPKDITGLVDVVSVDPAVSSGHWGILHWADDPASKVSWVIAGWRPQMPASDFLDTVDVGQGATGLRGFMVDLQRASIDQGHRIRAWVIESNRAEWLSTTAMRMFRDQYPDVAIITTSTQKNKTDPMLGVEATLPGRFRAGEIRLPYKGLEARNLITAFRRELLRYPNAKVFDLVMSTWLHDLNRDAVLQAVATNIVHPTMPDLPRYLKNRQREMPIDRSRLLGAREEIPPGYEPIPAGDPRRERESFIPGLS
jgi:hypothetical protein